MKVAIVSDSHGNATALTSVIKDAQKNHADQFWSLGDIALTGPGSEACYRLLDQINTTHFLRGNWEDTYGQVREKDLVNLEDPEDIAAVMQVRFDELHFSADIRKQIAGLPFKQEFSFEGIKFALYHNSPDSDHGHQMLPTNRQENFDLFSKDTNADIIIYVHVHQQLLRYTDSGQMILNPGSVGEPWAVSSNLLLNRRANYLLMDVDNGGISNLEFKHIGYNLEKEIDLAYSRDLPYANLYERLIKTGKGFTHDDQSLIIENKKHGYRSLAEEFLSQINSSTHD
ncbi:putative Diadenosine tetraphosphatase-like serine/threonine protein phosphatase [Oenococcus oeni]|uniref:metallophosphoesterase family protein n=1 Tax=Oenococcus oeni TaxID=1247 RepID=UPI0010B0B5BE|nr:metallophosphoesterase family protein [Oenococcus oeni]SYW04983.1 putative Diadenosine tetraphosphatase-like serine/threonine protein phosphatase [Oenococcus oeni]